MQTTPYYINQTCKMYVGKNKVDAKINWVQFVTTRHIYSD